jgi:hypothetical protein
LCQICDVSASEIGAGAAPRFAAAYAAEPGLRRAAPVFAAAGIERELFRA